MSTHPMMSEAAKAIKNAADLTQLEAIRVKYLGRKGIVTEELKRVGTLPAEQRSAAGAAANQAKAEIEQALEGRQAELRSELIKTQTASSQLDLTAPQLSSFGHRHPVDSMMEEVIRLFWQMGFKVADGPEVETEWYCFDALNIPKDHPARDMQDTFYIEGGGLPRTHTSSVQIRYMEQNHPAAAGAIRIIAPGKVYRNEDEDPTHLWMFHQLEGLVVDEDVSIGDLKGTLLAMMRGLLGEDAQVRLRQNFFPYTEPSVEVDAKSQGWSIQGMAEGEWLELLGAGMVHPKVLANVGIDPERYTGFAFGVGLERLAALKYGVSDIREFWRPNLKFLEQF